MAMWANKLPFSRFIVRENSMSPSYKEGEHALTFNWMKARVSDVVVFRKNGVFYIKRVRNILKDLIYVVGDNKKESLDFDPIKRSQIIGKVILKY